MATKILSNIGQRQDWKIKQGATFGPVKVTLRNPPVSPATVGTPMDLTGCTIRGQVRRTGLSGTIIATLVCEIVDPPAGEFTYGLTAAETALIKCGELIDDDASIYQWDLELVDAASRVIDLLWGDFLVFREVTR